MPFRFRRSFRIAPGIRLNVSKSGTSWSFVGRGARVTTGKRGTRETIGVPGTGLSWSRQRGRGTGAPGTAPPARIGIMPRIGLAMLGFFLLVELVRHL